MKLRRVTQHLCMSILYAQTYTETHYKSHDTCCIRLLPCFLLLVFFQDLLVAFFHPTNLPGSLSTLSFMRRMGFPHLRHVSQILKRTDCSGWRVNGGLV